MGYPGRQNIYDAAIRRMVSEALEQQEAQFRAEHGEDPDEALLQYLRSCAMRLQHTPWPGEILGGAYIAERFGTWTDALRLARLRPPHTKNNPQSFARVIRETAVQKEVYRQRKAARRELSQKRRMEQEKQKKHGSR